jgi:hypothetical protein
MLLLLLLAVSLFNERWQLRQSMPSHYYKAYKNEQYMFQCLSRCRFSDVIISCLKVHWYQEEAKDYFGTYVG